MGIFLWVVIGVAMGLVARRIMPGPAFGGLGLAVLLGVLGAVVGGFAANASGGKAFLLMDVASLVCAFTLGCLVLLCYRSIALRTAE